VPLGLGVLLSRCIFTILLTDIDICELVHLTIKCYSIQSAIKPIDHKLSPHRCMHPVSHRSVVPGGHPS